MQKMAKNMKPNEVFGKGKKALPGVKFKKKVLKAKESVADRLYK